MDILYIAFKDFAKLHFGASKKVISECRAFESAGHRVTLIGREGCSTVRVDIKGNTDVINSHKRFPISKLQPLFDKYNQLDDIISFIKGKKYEFCYIRFDLCSAKFIHVIEEIKKVCPKIYIEIPTYPYDKEYVGWFNKCRMLIDSIYAKRLKDIVNRVISFYDIPNNSFYGVPVLVVPNGFDFDGIDIIKEEPVPEDIHIAAVSSMRLWHGYERMIEGLHKYYCNGGNRDIFLHIVGDGREGVKYKELTVNYRLQDHVIFHGALHGEELNRLLEKCTLGLDSLGRHRTGISKLSSLKSREYGAKGIPFINSCDIDIVTDDFPYFMKVPADETPIEIDDVVNFYDHCYIGGSRILVAKDIRSYIENRSNMQTVMDMVLESLDAEVR